MSLPITLPAGNVKVLAGDSVFAKLVSTPVTCTAPPEPGCSVMARNRAAFRLPIVMLPEAMLVT